MRRKQTPRPSSNKSDDPPNAFKAWPYQPEYTAIALIRKGGLWSVLQLKLKAREVQTYDITTESTFEASIDKAIRKLAQSVRRPT
jgi:hypothetical protein